MIIYYYLFYIIRNILFIKTKTNNTNIVEKHWETMIIGNFVDRLNLVVRTILSNFEPENHIAI